MSKVFRVSITIPQQKLATVLQVLTKEGSDLKVESVGDGPINTMKTPRKSTKRGSIMTDAVVTWIRKMPVGTEFTAEQVRGFLSENDMKAANYSPIMSNLMRDTNIVVATGAKGTYRATGK